MQTDQGLFFACLLNGKTASQPLTWDQIHTWSSQQGPLWIHLDRMGTDSQHWLQENSGRSASGRRDQTTNHGS